MNDQGLSHGVSQGSKDFIRNCAKGYLCDILENWVPALYLSPKNLHMADLKYDELIFQEISEDHEIQNQCQSY